MRIVTSLMNTESLELVYLAYFQSIMSYGINYAGKVYSLQNNENNGRC
jgi:hypothetical protein